MIDFAFFCAVQQGMRVLAGIHAPHNTKEMKSGAKSKKPQPVRVAVFEARVAGVTGLEPAASGVTGRRSNQLSYTPFAVLFPKLQSSFAA